MRPVQLTSQMFAPVAPDGTMSKLVSKLQAGAGVGDMRLSGCDLAAVQPFAHLLEVLPTRLRLVGKEAPQLSAMLSSSSDSLLLQPWGKLNPSTACRRQGAD